MQYDGVGNRSRLTWPSGTNGSGAYYVTYQYDAMNRMTEIDQNGSTSTPLAKYQWDLLSRQQLITYGDGTTDSYSSYDAADNLQTLTQTYAGADNAVTFSYTWQKNHQRASVGVSDGVFQYVPPVGTTDYAAANADNGYVSLDNSITGNTSFTYDGNQNMAFDGVNTLTYDVENRLVEAQNGPSGTSTYLYDPLGQRRQKTVGVGSPMPVTTQFVLAGGQEIADYNGTGAGTPWMLTVRGVGGLPVAAVTPSASGSATVAAYYHHDAMGSTVAVTAPGSSGAADGYTYSDYGAPGAGSWATYRYAGYRYDNETGLYYVGARYYSPTLGRFLQTDPAGLSGGTNLYAYVGNDPLNLFDPDGLSPGDVYGVAPNGSMDQGGITTIMQFAYGGATGVPYQHVFTEINPDPVTGEPLAAESVPGGVQIDTIADIYSNYSLTGNQIDVYSPNTPLTDVQLTAMTVYAYENIGAPYNYAISPDLGAPFGAVQCAQFADDLANAGNAAAPIPYTSNDILGLPVPLPSNLSNSTSYSFQYTVPTFGPYQVQSAPAYSNGK